MDLESLFSSKALRRIEKAGEITIAIVSLILASDYFKVFSLSTIPFPSLNYILWGYLLLNVGVANGFKFLKNKDNPHCPKCNRKLNELKEYECPKCGKLTFD